MLVLILLFSVLTFSSVECFQSFHIAGKVTCHKTPIRYVNVTLQYYYNEWQFIGKTKENYGYVKEGGGKWTNQTTTTTVTNTGDYNLTFRLDYKWVGLPALEQPSKWRMIFEWCNYKHKIIETPDQRIELMNRVSVDFCPSTEEMDETCNGFPQAPDGRYKIKGRFICKDGKPARKGGIVKVFKWISYHESEKMGISIANVLEPRKGQIKIRDNGAFEHWIPFYKTAERDKSVQLQFQEEFTRKNGICQKNYSELRSAYFADIQISKDFGNVKLSPMK